MFAYGEVPPWMPGPLCGNSRAESWLDSTSDRRQKDGPVCVLRCRRPGRQELLPYDPWTREISERVDEVIRGCGFGEETPQVADTVVGDLSSKASQGAETPQVAAKVVQDLSPRESWAAYTESVYQKSRGVIFGALYHEGSSSEDDSGNSQRLVGRKEFFASLGSVQELKDFMFNIKQVLHFIVSRNKSAEVLNFSVSEEFRSSLLKAMKSRNWEEVESMVMPIAAALPRRAAIYDAFLFLASLLLSVVSQYLMGLVDKGGTKPHSSGSLEFRSTFISTVLFKGAYVWIKFREVAPPSQRKPLPGLYRKHEMRDGVKVYHGNYEPRFKPRGSDSYISVGSYEKEEDARIVYQILAFYYGREVPGELPLLNGSTYPLPRMTEEEQRLDPETKKEWAKGKVKAVFEDFTTVSMVYEFLDPLLDSQEVQATGGISNTLPPDASARCDGQPFQLGNQSGGLVHVSPSNSSRNVDPGMQDYVASDSFSDRAVDRAGVGDQPPPEPQFQQHALEENQANNVNFDDLSVLSLVKELQRQQELQALQIEQQASQILEQKSQILQHESRIQKEETRTSGLERHLELKKLDMQQQKSRISELEGEVERLSSTAPARKRFCVGLSLRHDLQN